MQPALTRERGADPGKENTAVKIQKARQSIGKAGVCWLRE